MSPEPGKMQIPLKIALLKAYKKAEFLKVHALTSSSWFYIFFCSALNTYLPYSLAQLLWRSVLSFHSILNCSPPRLSIVHQDTLRCWESAG